MTGTNVVDVSYWKAGTCVKNSGVVVDMMIFMAERVDPDKWDPEQGVALEVFGTQARRVILVYLREHPGGVKAREIHLDTGIPVPTVGDALTLFRINGVVDAQIPDSGKGYVYELNRTRYNQLVDAEFYFLKGERPG